MFKWDMQSFPKTVENYKVRGPFGAEHMYRLQHMVSAALRAIDPWKWAHCVFSYSHIMPVIHPYSYSRLGEGEDSYASE